MVTLNLLGWLSSSPRPGCRQVVDTGVDVSSCFFVDEDKKEVEHGHFFEEIGVSADEFSSVSLSSSDAHIGTVFKGGYFPFDLSRRKVRRVRREWARGNVVVSLLSFALFIEPTCVWRIRT